jgi:hypothetical protein
VSIVELPQEQVQDKRMSWAELGSRPEDTVRLRGVHRKPEDAYRLVVQSTDERFSHCFPSAVGASA